jgi:poly(beta-D-mannuronate) lyase
MENRYVWADGLIIKSPGFKRLLQAENHDAKEQTRVRECLEKAGTVWYPSTAKDIRYILSKY